MFSQGSVWSIFQTMMFCKPYVEIVFFLIIIIIIIIIIINLALYLEASKTSVYSEQMLFLKAQFSEKLIDTGNPKFTIF